MSEIFWIDIKLTGIRTNMPPFKLILYFLFYSINNFNTKMSIFNKSLLRKASGLNISLLLLEIQSALKGNFYNLAYCSSEFCSTYFPVLG